MISIGIIGLPNAGKSTLFNLLSKQNVEVANYPFTTISPNKAVVAAKDERLEQIQKIYNSKQIFPYPLEFIDIAGLVKGAHQGAGLGNQFLAHIRECNALIHVIRSFENPQVVHLEGEINIERDFQIVQNELYQKDLQSKEKVNLLSKKPQLILVNGKLNQKINFENFDYLEIDLSRGLTSEQIKQIFEKFYKLLNLICFFTANQNEARSYLIKVGTPIVEAARLVHSDFAEKFIRAEVINYSQLKQIGDYKLAKLKGLVKIKGKDYLVQEGDIVYFKI